MLIINCKRRRGEMLYKKYRIEHYYQCPECPECGGDISIQVGSVMVMTSPVKRKYACEDCGYETMIRESEFPQIKWNKIDKNPFEVSE